VSYHRLANPADLENDEDNIPFYKTTEENRKIIKFIADATNKSNELLPINIKKINDEIIKEQQDSYEVSC
jgi:hypothetical protein